MKLYAQHGHGDGSKIIEGLSEGLIDGVIFSPKDIKPEKLREQIEALRFQCPKGELYFDPQVYVAMIANDARANLGRLEEYVEYFSPQSRNRLEVEKNVMLVLRRVIAYEAGLGLDGIISPNILISRSFDSRDATISKTFIRMARECFGEYDLKVPLYATLAVSRDALANPLELQEFLNDITVLDEPPDGYYVLIASTNSETRLDLYNADVLAGWLLLNYSLAINGFKVMNGYSDILTPFLGAVGGSAGATGWWSNTRSFSMDRFLPTRTGGSLPIQRYLSNKLLNRIRFDEYQSWVKFVPAIRNNLSRDKLYKQEPERPKEVLQSWEALHKLVTTLVSADVRESLALCEVAIDHALESYEQIQIFGLRPDPKSNSDHLEPLQEGIRKFRKYAEL
jgi:hypothetical protein